MALLDRQLGCFENVETKMAENENMCDDLAGFKGVASRKGCGQRVER